MAKTFIDPLETPAPKKFVDPLETPAAPVMKTFVDPLEAAAPESPKEKKFVDPLEQQTPSYVVSDDEVQEIAQKHGVDPKWLKESVAWYGGLPQGMAMADVARLGGYAANEAASGVPGFIYKKLQDEQHEKAMDDLSSLVESKKSLAQKVGEFALGLAVPGVGVSKAAGLGAKVAAGAATGALASMAASKSGEEVSAALTGAALGGTIGAAAEAVPVLVRRLRGTDKLAKNVKELAETPTSRLATSIEDKVSKLKATPEYAERTSKELEDLISGEGNIRKKVLAPFKKKGETVDEAWVRVTKDKDPEQLYQDFAHQRDMLHVTSDLPKAEDMNAFESTIMNMTSNKNVANIADGDLGTKLSVHMDDASQRIKDVDAGLGELANKALQSKTLQAIDQVPEEVRLQAIKAVEGKAPVTADIADLVKELRTMAKDRLAFAKANGVKMREIEDYYPHLVRQGDRYREAMQKKYAQAASGDQAAMAELQKEVGHILGLDPKDIGTSDIVDTVHALVTTKAVKKTGKTADLQAAVTKTREKGEVPSWLLETDPRLAYQQWDQKMKKQIVYEPLVKEFDIASKIARRTGREGMADLLDAAAADWAGRTRKRTTKVSDAIDSLVETYRTKVRAPGTKEEQILRENLAEGAGLLEAATNRVYGSALGLSPKATLTNVAATLAGAIPEAGVVDIYRGTKRMADVLARGRTVTLSKAGAAALNAGKTGKVFQEGQEYLTRNPNFIAINSGLADQKWLESATDVGKTMIANKSMFAKMGKKLSDAEMAAFGMSERLSRGWLAMVGEEMGERITRDPEALSKIKSVAYRRAIQKAATAGDQQEVNRLVTHYLNSHVPLNFDPVNQGLMARSLPSFLRPFVTYPAFIPGRALQLAKQEGVTTAAKYFLAPYAALEAVDQLADLGKESEHPVIAYLTNKEGLSSYTPASTLIKTVAGKQPALPGMGAPLVRSATGLFGGQAFNFTEDSQGYSPARRFWESQVSTYAPGSSLLRFVAEDIPALTGSARIDTSVPPITRRLQQLSK